MKVKIRELLKEASAQLSIENLESARPSIDLAETLILILGECPEKVELQEELEKCRSSLERISKK